jgi:hypothetical protein
VPIDSSHLSISLWTERVKIAQTLIDKGQTQQWLYGHDDERPWNLTENVAVDSMQPVSAYVAGQRIHVSSGVQFKATHPSGLTFFWSMPLFDINSPVYVTNLENIRRAKKFLPPTVLAQFKDIIHERVMTIIKILHEERSIVIAHEVAEQNALRSLHDDGTGDADPPEQSAGESSGSTAADTNTDPPASRFRQRDPRRQSKL